jgi:hypothetical protein
MRFMDYYKFFGVWREPFAVGQNSAAGKVKNQSGGALLI